MRRLGTMIGLWLGLFLTAGIAGTYTLTDGTRVTGDPVAISDDSVQIHTDDDKYPKIPWARLTGDSLKQLLAEAKTPQQKAIIEPLIEELPQEKAKYADITVTPIVAPPRPQGRTGLFAIFTSPVGWIILLALYAANIFAASEVAAFRNQPLRIVCGLAAVPLFGTVATLYFLAMPTRPRTGPDPDEDDREPPRELPAKDAPEDSFVHGNVPDPEKWVAVAAGKPPPGVPAPQRGAAPPAPAQSLPEPVVFRKNDFSFNRRFFETKMPGFFRVVLSEADRDMVILVISSRGEFVGKRIPRITAAELYLEVFRDDATAEEMIPFMEIQEVQIRHKDLQ